MAFESPFLTFLYTLGSVIFAFSLQHEVVVEAEPDGVASGLRNTYDGQQMALHERMEALLVLSWPAEKGIPEPSLPPR